MKRHFVKSLVLTFLLFLLLISSCNHLNQDDLLADEKIELNHHDLINLRYAINQTGIDNYRYDFYIVEESDTISLFTSYLDDAVYTNVVFNIQEAEDSIIINSNYELGESEKKVGKLSYILRNPIINEPRF